jgi:hypothetical protein
VGLLVAWPLAAGAGEVSGKVSRVDPANGTATLEDGITIWVSQEQLESLIPGETVLTSFEVRDGKAVATRVERRTLSPAGWETTNFGSTRPFSEIELQAPGSADSSD